MDPARLKTISLFHDLPDDHLPAIATFATEKSFAEGTELVREGDYAYELFGIEEGNVEVRHDGAVLATLGPGDVFGETGVLESDLRNATVISTSPVRTIIFAHWDVRRLRKNVPDFDERLAALIEQRRA